jgi:hypothetical protein
MINVEDDDFRPLEFEDAHPVNDHKKDSFLHTEFDLTRSAYFERLLRLVEEPEVIETYPLVRRRLMRMRARRHQARDGTAR